MPLSVKSPDERALTKGGTSYFNEAVTANYEGWMWLRFVNHFTKTGTVFAYMSGDVSLVNGEICSIDLPNDTEHVG